MNLCLYCYFLVTDLCLGFVVLACWRFHLAGSTRVFRSGTSRESCLSVRESFRWFEFPRGLDSGANFGNIDHFIIYWESQSYPSLFKKYIIPVPYCTGAHAPQYFLYNATATSAVVAFKKELLCTIRNSKPIHQSSFSSILHDYKEACYRYSALLPAVPNASRVELWRLVFRIVNAILLLWLPCFYLLFVPSSF